MAKGSGGGGRGGRSKEVTARGLRAGSVALPVVGGFAQGPVRITRVERGVAYGTALNAPAGTMGAREMVIGNRSTRFLRYTGTLTGDRYTDQTNIGRFFRGR